MSNKVTTQPAADAAIDLPKGKLGLIIRRLQQPGGASLNELIDATGWQAHSVRGALAGAIKKRLGLVLHRDTVDGLSRYWIASPDVVPPADSLVASEFTKPPVRLVRASHSRIALKLPDWMTPRPSSKHARVRLRPMGGRITGQAGRRISRRRVRIGLYRVSQ